MDSGGGGTTTPRPLPIGHFLTMLPSRTPPCWTGLRVESLGISDLFSCPPTRPSTHSRKRSQQHAESAPPGSQAVV